MYCWSSVRVTYLQFYLLLPDSGNRYCQLSKGIKYGQPSAVVGCHQSSAAIRYCQPSVGVTVSDLQVLGILLPICRCWGILLAICRCFGNTVAHLQAPDTVSQAGSVGKNRAKPVGPLCTSPHCNTVPKTLLQDGSTSTYCRTVPHAPHHKTAAGEKQE